MSRTPSQASSATIIDKPATKRMNGDEYEAFRALFGLASEWERAGATLERRIRTITGGWRDAKLLQSKSIKLIEGITQTIPSEQIVKIAKDLKHTHVKVSVGRDFANEPGYTYLPLNSLRGLIDGAMEKCNFCDCNYEQARKCELRKSLDAVTLNDLPELDGCAYRKFSFMTLGSSNVVGGVDEVGGVEERCGVVPS